MSLLRVARNVSDLDRLRAFYIALGFAPEGSAEADLPLASLLGVAAVRRQRLRLGAQTLDLTACLPVGAGYPANAPGNASLFQHIALLTPDIHAAATRALSAGARPISQGGPVRLPPESGGVIAWKFRDPDGHPLEYLQRDAPPGYDHSGIVATRPDAALPVYAALGLHLQAEQLNQGPAQARLDGVPGATARILTLRGAEGPGVELLAYSQVAPFPPPHPADLAADRLVFKGPHPALQRDPDGHLIEIAPG